MRIGTYAAVIAALMLSGLRGYAQTGAASVTGMVQDASHAVVPAAKVALRNVETDVRRDTSASAEGRYYFGAVPPGRYEMIVEVDGFKRWRGEVTLEVGQSAEINPTMEVGSVSNTVEVAAAAPVITTEGMGLADVKDSLRIQELPLNSRDITSLFDLTAGVEGGGAPRVNGIKVGGAEIMQDGVSIVNRFSGGAEAVRPGLETVREFRVETSGSGARYAQPATIQMVTKSGTNALRGSLFETFRDNAAGLRARQRQDTGGAAKYLRNEFGGSIGGPVYLPGVYNGKNRSFFFASYEGMRLRQSVLDRDYVPTAEMWSGNFSQIIDNNRRQTHIYDPLTTAGTDATRTPFAGDIIPQSRLSAQFKLLQSITHLPSTTTNPFQDFNLTTYYPDRQNTDTLTIKGDQRFSDRNNFYGRLTRSHFTQKQDGGRFGSPAPGIADAYGTRRADTRVYSLSLNDVHTFTPTILSEFQLSANRNPNGQGTLADFSPWAERLGLPNPFGVLGWPTLSFGKDPFQWDADNHKDQNLTAYRFENNTTWIRRNHTIQFGTQMRKEYNNIRELQQAQGSNTFGSDWTSLYDARSNQPASFTGDGLASMALGLVTGASVQYNRGYFYFRQWDIGLYAQDSWRVTRRLSIDYGLRWEKWTPFKERFDRLVNVDLDAANKGMQVITPNDTSMESLPGVPPSLLASWAKRGMTWKTANQLGFPSALTPAINTDFGPRLGFAYRLTNLTVIRGGYGRYFWPMPLSQILQTSRTNPPLNLRYQNQIDQSDNTTTFALRAIPQPDQYLGRVHIDINGIVSISNSAQNFMPWDVRNWKDDMAQSWYFTLEREFMKGTALKLTYTGNYGSNLEQRFSVNAQEAIWNYVERTHVQAPSARQNMRVNPNWAFDAANHTGYSNTHSAQLEVQRRFRSGLAFQWFYVYTRSMTTTDAGAGTAGTSTINDVAGSPQVPENLHLFGEPNLTYEQRQRLIYYNSTNVPPHRMRWNYLYELPVGKGKRFGKNLSGAMNALLGGWQLAGLGSWRSGNWLSVNAGEYMFANPALNADQRLTFYYNGKLQRLYFRGDFDPTRATGVDMNTLLALVAADQGQRVVRKLGPNFDNRLPQTLSNGTVTLTPITDLLNWNSRAFFLGPRNWNVDASLFKSFKVKERGTLQFRADFFNALNHPNDVNPNNTTGLQDLSTQSNEPRIVQFTLRLSW